MKKISMGDSASINKIFTVDEVKNYADISNDTNPIHLDHQYTAKTFFKKPIVQGLLVTSLFGGLLGSKLPGKGTIQLGQKVKFFKPVYIGEEVTATIKVINIRQDKPIITFSTKCYNESGKITIDGKAVVYYKGEIFI